MVNTRRTTYNAELPATVEVTVTSTPARKRHRSTQCRSPLVENMADQRLYQRPVQPNITTAQTPVRIHERHAPSTSSSTPQQPISETPTTVRDIIATQETVDAKLEAMVGMILNNQ